MRPLNSELLKQEIEEYFEYIKTVYLNEFSSYMTDEVRGQIQNTHDIFELNEELTFRVIQDKKIIFNLDLAKMIDENDLTNETNLSDISQCGRDYIQYLITNKEHVDVVVKNQVLKEVITYFLGCAKNVISLGVRDMIVEYLGERYKIHYEKFIPSKEKEVALYIKEIVGEQQLLSAFISKNEDIIRYAYNSYIENKDLENYDCLKDSLNKIYYDYVKKIGKVYFTDSLYEYQNLEYGISLRSKKVKEEKKKLSTMHLKRLISLKNSLTNINKHQFLFTAQDKMILQNSIIETDKVMNSIVRDGKEHVLDYIDSEYPKILKIEKASQKFVDKIWSNTLTNVLTYQCGHEFNLLLASQVGSKIIEATYLTSEHLKSIHTSRNDYGFVVEPKQDGIVYISNKDLLYRNYSDDPNYCANANTVYSNQIILEIDNQETSKLITPNMIVNENLKDKIIQNKVILDGENIRVVGIYAFSDEEESPSYNKATLLSEEYGLPVIRISSRSYFNGKEIERPKIDVHIKEVEVPEKSFFDKIKEARNKLFYEEAEAEPKKVA